MSYIGNQPAQTSSAATIANGSVTTPSLANGAATLAKLDTTGAAGNVLTAQGPGVAPIWAPAAASPTGNLISVALYTSGTTITPPAGCTKMLAELVGGGGGGAGVASGAIGDVGGGGGSGAYAMKLFSVVAGTAYACSIGAGGAGSATTLDGSSGGNTTLTVGGTTVTARGGEGGRRSTASAAAAGGAATNGDINFTGMSGSVSSQVNGADQLSFGGNPPMGFGTGGMSAQLSASANGAAGYGFGAGGSGARCVSSGSAATGGAGAGGCIRVWFYA